MPYYIAPLVNILENWCQLKQYLTQKKSTRKKKMDFLIYVVMPAT